MISGIIFYILTYSNNQGKTYYDKLSFFYGFYPSKFL